MTTLKNASASHLLHLPYSYIHQWNPTKQRSTEKIYSGGQTQRGWTFEGMKPRGIRNKVQGLGQTLPTAEVKIGMAKTKAPHPTVHIKHFNQMVLIIRKYANHNSGTLLVKA